MILFDSVQRQRANSAYYEDVQNRQWLTICKKMFRLQCSGKYTLGSPSHNAAALEKKMPEWKFQLVKWNTKATKMSHQNMQVLFENA